MDNYRGLCYPGGVLRKPFVLGLVSGLTMAALWPGPVSGKEPPMNIIAEILANTEDGPFWWGHGGGWKDISNIKVPVLNLVHTPNRLHAIDHLKSYVSIRSPKKLIITPWTNENYQPWIFETTSFNQYILPWLDYWLKDIDTGIMNEPEVAIYDNGTGRWRHEKEYPLQRAQWTKYYLREKNTAEEPYGLITQTPPGEEEPDAYHNIGLNTARAASYGISAATPTSHTANAAYVSLPLDEDLCIWSPISFRSYASTTEEATSDWSFFIKMSEMVPHGVPRNPVTGDPEIRPEANDACTPQEVQIWSRGSLKAKFRKVDETRSRPGMPWHSFLNPEDLTPPAIYEFQIELQPVFKTFKKGCSIWLKIASDDALFSTWDVSSRYAETPLLAAKNVISVYHDGKHPSHLLLPVLPDAPEIEPVKPPLCEAVPGAARFTL